ncbi:putative mitochondrial adp/ATP carrier-like protein [Leptomonas pyrrhocoris]|uniref:ADP/ATP translocase n=1 Tax=Leptomonas pyrrhocoris TaxID=157538 RepID=A0A0M9FR25_LEPPY|nr:putative mitochondrial adp/ATP carrier-like protein [Leptomonas pyrrhocoris]KPA74330.1 putative mitochondrial adp/ATP carrier-like protein [Leptomonas pyrrhocoris]|eukprot:XP_015652769.1 putative mitochondrial adp/ATP carrier-like protein [Leptomonas pyrrhocoris]
MPASVVAQGGGGSPSSGSGAAHDMSRLSPSSAECSPEQRRERARRYDGDDSTFISVEYIQQLWLLRSVSRTLLAPIERVKYVMQCQKELQRTGAIQCEFKTVWSCVRYLKQMEGTRRFWRGNLIQVVSLLPILLAQIFIAYPTQSFIFNSCPVHTAAGYTVASYAALLGGAVAATTVSYPLEYARFRLAVDVKSQVGASYEFRNSFAFFSHPVLSECPHYFYRGLTLYIFGSVVYQAVHNVLLNVVAPYVPPEEDSSSWAPAIIQTIAGLTVSGTTTLCLHPVDLVRHRMMIAVMEDRLRYASMMECATQIAQREGLRGFFRGGTVTLTKMIAATGLVLFGLPY